MPANLARQYHTQQVHYIRRRVNFNDAGIATGVLAGTLPAGALLVGAAARVTTAFNAATTNVVNCGTTATGGEILATAVIIPGTTGFKAATSGTAFAGLIAADTDVFVSYTQSGTAATAGVVDIVISYVPNNDG